MGRESTRYSEQEMQFSRSRETPRKEELLQLNRWVLSSTHAPAAASTIPKAARDVIVSRPSSAAAASVKTGMVAVRIVVLIAVVSDRPRMKRIWLKDTPRSP
jgi:hypothetical protein